MKSLRQQQARLRAQQPNPLLMALLMAAAAIVLATVAFLYITTSQPSPQAAPAIERSQPGNGNR